MIIETKELYGTTLDGPVHRINDEPEHRRVGLVWALSGDFLTIQSGPKSNANLAAHRIIADEVAKHVTAGGVNLTFNLPSGVIRYEVGAGRVINGKV